MAEIILQDIEKYFGAVYVIRKLNLTIKDREFVVLLGPSGCGKTTTLRAIAGLEDITAGNILIDGKPVQNLKGGDRDIAFVFQLFALYPHLTAYENIAFPLRATRESKANVDAKVRAVTRSLQIEHLLGHRPSSLSGGDMQRVAIGRALVRRPKAMLMDEPMGALDAKLREEMRTELKRLHLENGSTTVYVTHDQVEAMSMADRIAIMNEGILQQVGTPDEVYHHPANLFVAQFVGSPVMNISQVSLKAEAKTTKLILGDQAFIYPQEIVAQINAASPQAEALTMGIRPEGVHLSRTSTPGYAPSQVQLVEPLGAYDIVDVKFGSTILRARTKSGFIAKKNEKIWVGLDPLQTHLFDSKTGQSLNIRLSNMRLGHGAN